MNQKTTAWVCFGCAAIWITLAAADVSRLQNGFIGGVLLIAGIASMRRHLRNEVPLPAQNSRTR
jgi:NO-binding membrane sensor protein with MHYT domain